MTKEEIFKLAKEANIHVGFISGELYTNDVTLLRFARAIERETLENAAKEMHRVMEINAAFRLAIMAHELRSMTNKTENNLF